MSFECPEGPEARYEHLTDEQMKLIQFIETNSANETIRLRREGHNLHAGQTASRFMINTMKKEHPELLPAEDWAIVNTPFHLMKTEMQEQFYTWRAGLWDETVRRAREKRG